MLKVGLIGCGNIGSAIVEGFRAKGEGELIVYDHAEAHCLKSECEGLSCVGSIEEVFENAQMIILAVGREALWEVLTEGMAYLTSNHMLVPTTVGFSWEMLNERLPMLRQAMQLRIVPNINFAIGQSVTGIVFDQRQDILSRDAVERWFKRFGHTLELPEYEVEAFAAVYASMPAYLSLFIEVTADAAEFAGMSRKRNRYEVTAEIMSATLQHLTERSVHPSALKDRVCSASGITIEGLNSLEDKQFRYELFASYQEAFRKAEHQKRTFKNF